MSELTDKIYFESRDPRVAELQTLVKPDGLPDLDARNTAAFGLDGKGLIIDRVIDIFGWSPSLVMGVRKTYGYRWCPSAFQPNPPLSDLGDTNKAFPRSIKVSTTAEDYPSFIPPIPVVAPSHSPIGVLNGDMYEVNIPVAQVAGQYLFKDGQTYTDSTGTFIFHAVPGMFGLQVFWTKN